MDRAQLLQLDQTIWVVQAPIGLHIYDFDFTQWFPFRIRRGESPGVVAVGRIGAFEDYNRQHNAFANRGIRLIHSPEEYQRASELSGWYPLLEDITPRSCVFEERPSAAEVASQFAFPLFVKGARQTSRHQRRLCIAESAADWESIMAAYASDTILSWQPVVVREFVPLRPVGQANRDGDHDRVPRSFEFRTFWWKGQLVGAGRYWWEGKTYSWTDEERRDALAIAQEAARRVNVPFLVVDVAMTATGEWIVIECNDAQESGYAGIAPIGLWQRIIDIERKSVT